MALSANASLTIANDTGKYYQSFVVGTAAVIYQHALCCVAATGNRLLAAANSTTLRFAGIALEVTGQATTFPVTGDTAGTYSVDCYMGLDVLLPITGITDGQFGDAIYAADDSKGYDLTTLGPQIGIMTKFVSATQGWIRLGATALGDAT